MIAIATIVSWQIVTFRTKLDLKHPLNLIYISDETLTRPKKGANQIIHKANFFSYTNLTFFHHHNRFTILTISPFKETNSGAKYCKYIHYFFIISNKVKKKGTFKSHFHLNSLRPFIMEELLSKLFLIYHAIILLPFGAHTLLRKLFWSGRRADQCFPSLHRFNHI